MVVILAGSSRGSVSVGLDIEVKLKTRKPRAALGTIFVDRIPTPLYAAGRD